MDEVIYECLEKVGNVLADNNIPFEHKERVKSIYGLYKQINKGRKIVDVHNLVAIKLMVNDINDCISHYIRLCLEQMTDWYKCK